MRERGTEVVSPSLSLLLLPLGPLKLRKLDATHLTSSPSTEETVLLASQQLNPRSHNKCTPDSAAAVAPPAMSRDLRVGSAGIRICLPCYAGNESEFSGPPAQLRQESAAETMYHVGGGVDAGIS